MKKTVAMLLVAVLCLGAFSGCQAKQGSVYYLNFKPEADQAWQDLAKLYTEKTGVQVKVITAAAGDYSNKLTAEMGKSSPPTLFNCGNAQGLADWEGYLLDLTGTALHQACATEDFNLTDESGKVRAIGYCYESFGLIVNKALLQELTGKTVEDIKNFDDLRDISQEITAKYPETGVAAFASPGLDSSSSWRFSGHLANMPLYYEFAADGISGQPAQIQGTYLENYKNIWDLYIGNTTCAGSQLSAKTADNAKAEFTTGKAVFYQNGSWEYAGLVAAGMAPGDLSMIPIYCGVSGEENAGLCSGTENCWAVNAKAPQADIDATLDFVAWVATSEEGLTMLSQQFGAVPFKNAKKAENVFSQEAARLLAEGKYTVTWAFNHTPNVDEWRGGVVSALTAYSAGSGDWSAVENAFVAGWKAQYDKQNKK